MEKIKIKCPNCGITLGIKSMPRDPDKSLTCPNCKVKNKFRDYHLVEQKQVDDETEIDLSIKDSIGLLEDLSTHRTYQLREGNNLVGRMTYATPPKADVKIETQDRGLSRAHFYIQVIKGRDGHYHHYIYNASNVNPTYLNDALLEDGDKPGLKAGDIIKSSDTSLRFVGNQIDDETKL